MFRQSLIAAAVAVATITSSASIGFAQAQTPAHHRTVVHHADTYEPAPARITAPIMAHIITVMAYYGSSTLAPVTNAAGAAACLAFSLIGAAEAPRDASLLETAPPSAGCWVGRASQPSKGPRMSSRRKDPWVPGPIEAVG